MYSILIVDDEPELANSLCEILQIQMQSELMAYKAYSAREALDLMNRIKIDIVLTDIKMPGMTGLDLFGLIKEKWPQCRVIFLTGYMQFDYVYTAIQNQGVRYLLKTEGDDNIIEAVRNTMAELDKSYRDENFIAKARQQVETALPILQKQFFQDILEGICIKDEITQEKLDELMISLDLSCEMILLVGKIDNIAYQLSSLERSKLLYYLKSMSDQYFSRIGNVADFILQQAYVVCIIQPVTGIVAQWDSYMAFLKGHIEYIQDACRVSKNITVSFAISTEPLLLYSLPEKYDALKQLLANSSVLGKEMILTEKSFFNSAEAVLSSDDTGLPMISRKLNRLNLLEACLESGRKSEYMRFLGEIIDGLRCIKNKSSNLALEIYHSIALLLLKHINTWHLTEKISFSIGVYKLTRTDEFNCWNDAVDYLFKLSEVIFDARFHAEEKKVQDSVTEVQKYISSNLSGDLSLVRLAELVNFNASYLSRLFKEVTGENLSDYINEIRIEKAKELLGHNSRKINEISREVGYESPHSFARFFRNAVGLSPQEYRESLPKRESLLKKGPMLREG